MGYVIKGVSVNPLNIPTSWGFYSQKSKLLGGISQLHECGECGSVDAKEIAE